jgi:hypothetical protein
MVPTDGSAAGSDTSPELSTVLGALRQRAWSGWTSLRNFVDVLTLRAFNLTPRGTEIHQAVNHAGLLFQECLQIIGPTFHAVR